MTYEASWELSSGLRESMDLTIDMAYFSTHAEYNNGNGMLLFIIGHDENGDPYEGRLSLGADWTSADGGKTVTHPSKKMFNKSTNYGHWITAAMAIPELHDILVDRGPASTAAVWENLVVHLELQKIVFGKNIDPQEKLLPTAFLGIVDATGPVSAPQQPLPISTGPPLTPAQTPVTIPSTGKTPAQIIAEARSAQQVSNGNTSPLYIQMTELAKQSPDYPSFLAAALANPDVLADDELAQQVADENGIWAATR